MSAVPQRKALASLTRARLVELAVGFELDAGSRAGKDELIDALARSRRASYEKVLDVLKRDELKAICRAHDLDDSGRAKNAIIERILGRDQLDIVLTEAAPEESTPTKRRRRPKNGADANVDTEDMGQEGGNGKMTLQRLESHLWGAANILRGSIDAADFKHHELCHLRHRAHSDEFWQLVGNVLAGWVRPARWLARTTGWEL